MVVLGGGAVSYERGTPVELALLTLPLALPIVASFVQALESALRMVSWFSQEDAGFSQHGT